MSQIDHDDQSSALSNILEKVEQLARKVALNHVDHQADLPSAEQELAATRSDCCPICGSCEPCDCCPCPPEECCPCPPQVCCPTRGISLADVMQAIADINKTSR